MQHFSEFGLDPRVLQAVEDMGFTEATEIQQKAIPILCGKITDFIGLAQTGTGKTAAFGLPLIHHIDPDNPKIQALILSPTRELSQQIANQLDSFSKHIPGFKSVTVYGGASIQDQIKKIKKGVHVVIATPGRLLDLIQRRAIKLQEISTLVLDEADEMLNMGFKEDLDAILSQTSSDKNTWLFSATMPREIRRIINDYMSHDAVEISVNQGNSSNANISHQYILCKTADKNEALKRYLDSFPDMRGIIFCRTKAGTQSLADGLSRAGYGAEAIHGDLSQAQRDRVMKKFKSHGLQVLVATDVAARGIDVNDLTHVIHHALPDDMSYYTHRSGRTARAGKKGISIAFVSGSDQRKLKMLQSKFDQEFEKMEVPSLDSVRRQRALNWASSLAESTVPKDFPSEILVAVFESLQEESKEDIIAKLLNKDLGSLMLEKEKSFQTDSPGRDRDDSGRRRERPSSEDRKRETQKGFHRYFINVGRNDDLDKGTLIDFLLETSGIPKKGIGEVRMLQRNSFFEIGEKYSVGFTDQFKQIFVGDRPLRVNRDDDGSNTEKPRKEGKRGGNYSGKSGGERRGGGGRSGGSRDKGKHTRKRRD